MLQNTHEGTEFIFLEMAIFAHFACAMLAVLQLVVVASCGAATAALVCACIYESLFVRRWARLDAELTSCFHHLSIQRPPRKKMKWFH